MALSLTQFCSDSSSEAALQVTAPITRHHRLLNPHTSHTTCLCFGFLGGFCSLHRHGMWEQREQKELGGNSTCKELENHRNDKNKHKSLSCYIVPCPSQCENPTKIHLVEAVWFDTYSKISMGGYAAPRTSAPNST